MASVFQKYPNLPGFVTEFKDGGLQVRREPTPPGTESVLLIGTALDGPIGEPVAVDATTVEEIFGKAVDTNGSFNGATLVKGFYEAYQIVSSVKYLFWIGLRIKSTSFPSLLTMVRFSSINLL